MTLNVNSVLCGIVTKRLRLELRGFPYEAALYLSYLHIKFDVEIQRKTPLISSIIYD